MPGFRLTTDRSAGRVAVFAIAVAAAIAGSYAFGERTADPPKMVRAAGASAPAPGFNAHQRNTQWRAPLLIGIEVYDRDGMPVGKVEDLLMSHDGVVQSVVIGVGGFLGFGTFAAMQWRMNPRPAAEAEAVAVEDPPASGAASGECVATPEAAHGRPDAATVTATLAELQSAPAFAYASRQGAAVGPDPTAGAGAPVSPHQ